MTAAVKVVNPELGIASAPLTCLPTNEAFRRMIERNGGILDNADQRVLRYWLPTS